MATIPLNEIPTISLLYRLQKLLPAESEKTGLPEPSQVFNDKVSIIRGDITKLGVDVIVNAANQRLLGGGGVDGAIHRAAGPDLIKECRTLRGCETGSAKITNGYNLPAKKIIHAVGPVYSSSKKKLMEELLTGCYSTSLKLAVENECKSIAFSSISTGVYGYPSLAAASVAIKTVRDFLEGESGEKLDKVVFTTFEQKDINAYDHWIP
jgi:O-acetyl-ADP-ribose deacetylase (regulator of RNase III)